MSIEPFPGRLNEPASKRFEAMSYLPPLSRDQIAQQLDYVLAKGDDIVIEHMDPANAARTYWYMWKLPLFGERNAEAILKEAEACSAAHQGDHVRVSSIDRIKQSQRLSLMVKRAGQAA